MNALTSVATGNPLVPHDMGAAMQLANMMATSKLVPVHLQKSAGDCLLVIEQAMRWQMSPFAVAQCTSVIQGKLMFEGKLVAAALNSSGILESRLREEFNGTGPTRTVTLRGTIRGETSPREIKVTLAEAKTSNGMWTKQPDQQLVYFATRAWARRHAPEVMLGVYSPEEFEDQKRDNFSGTTIEVRPDPEQVMQPTEQPKAKRTWGDFLDELDLELANAATTDEVDEILARATVQKAQDTLQNGAKDRLQDMLNNAIQRTTQAAVDDAVSDAVEDPEPDVVPPTTDALMAKTLEMVQHISARNIDTLPALTASGKYTRFVDDLEKSGRLDLMNRIRDANAAVILRVPT